VVHDGGVPLRQLNLDPPILAAQRSAAFTTIGGSKLNAGRGLVLALALLVALACAPAAAHATGEPIARWTCSAPGLQCDPCPVHCSSPAGKVAAGVSVRFDGRVSSDDRPGAPAGVVVAWQWTFGDGTSITSPVVDHAFGAAATYPVSLKVFDNEGKTDTKTLNIVVAATSIAGVASPQIVLGAGALTHTATVSGRSGSSAGATIDFRAYGPDDALCTGAPAFQSLGVAYPAAGGPVTSAPFSPAQAGVYRWIASYSGDSGNPPVQTKCSDPGASVLVSAPPPPPPPPPPPVVVDPLPAPRPTCFGKTATIVAVPGHHVITGTARADVIVGSDGDDTIDGRGGNDTICARGGDDTVRGSSGNDRLYGDSGADLLLGGTGADDVHGGSGDDRIAGGDDRDRVDGGTGNDVLDESKLGGGGSDRLIGGSGADRIRAADGTHDSVDCGGGTDIAQLDVADRQSRCDIVRRFSAET
jgi:Ca2+-binding RTX toxin-like protein